MTKPYSISNPTGCYFITFATVGWIDVFSRRRYVEILLESIKHCQAKKGLIIHAWVIMSNHVHFALSSQKPGALSGILPDLKKFTSGEIIREIQRIPESRKEWMLPIFKAAGKFNSNNKSFQFWQQDNHAVELVSNDFIKQKVNYNHENPIEAGVVMDATHYLYSSAMDYAGGKGLLEVERLF